MCGCLEFAGWRHVNIVLSLGLLSFDVACCVVFLHCYLYVLVVIACVGSACYSGGRQITKQLPTGVGKVCVCSFFVFLSTWLVFIVMCVLSCFVFVFLTC